MNILEASKEVGIKHDTEKNRMELLPPLAAQRISEIMTFGAKKYSKVVELDIFTIFALCKQKNILEYPLYVTQISLVSPEECVETVMIDGSKKTTLSMLKGKSKTYEDGELEITNTSANLKRLEIKLPSEKRHIEKANSAEDWKNWGSHLCSMRASALKDAKFAGTQNFYTLTMTTRQGNLEVYYAVSATTVLECLETLLKVLKDLSLISNEVQVQTSTTGAWNWSNGIAYSRLYGALQRHMTAWYTGQELDPETGKSHLWHAGCCIMFLIEMAELRTDLDDRPKHYPQT